MIVVDANILVSLYLINPHQGDVETLLATDPHWLAPRLWRSEVRNVLVQYVRHGKMTLLQAMTIIEYGEALMQSVEVEPGSSQIIRLAHNSGCSAYDCEYVALAGSLRAPLITLDKKLLAAFPNIAHTPRAFLGLVN